jgi:hypothetical protein
MAAEDALQDSDLNQTPDTEGERERSTIGFPYGDLDDAVAVAKAVHEVGGSSCEWEQLAAKLGQAATGGGFRQRALTAKTFGFITYSQGRVTLTALGSKICDSKQEKSAKAEAFLTVELYKTVYEKFKGGVLPPPKGLEAEMVALGVANKQKEKARQVFQRSATQAGFFWSGQDRLVMPAKGNGEFAPQVDGSKDDPDKKGKENLGGRGGGGGGDQHPFIQGLIKTLPPPESDWPMDGRRKWLQAASQIFELIYKDSDSKGSLRVEIQRDPAK